VHHHHYLLHCELPETLTTPTPIHTTTHTYNKEFCFFFVLTPRSQYHSIQCSEYREIAALPFHSYPYHSRNINSLIFLVVYFRLIRIRISLPDKRKTISIVVPTSNQLGKLILLYYILLIYNIIK
jgi:hypothetical protein